MRLALTIICAALLVAPATAAAAVAVPTEARAVSTSHPDRWVGHGTRAQLHVARGRARGRQGRGHPLPLRARQGQDRDEGDRQGGQHQPPRRPRRPRQGHAQRRREAPHPLPGHLRQTADLDHLALRRPGDAAARRAEPHLRERQLHRRDVRGRRWRRDLHPRRPAQDRALAVHRQPLRPDGAGPGRRRRAGAVAVPRPAGLRDPQHVHPRGLQQRRRAQQHRRVVVDLQQRLHAQPRDRARRQPPAIRARRAAAPAARSTRTATTSACWSPARA